MDPERLEAIPIMIPPTPSCNAGLLKQKKQNKHLTGIDSQMHACYDEQSLIEYLTDSTQDI